MPCEAQIPSIYWPFLFDLVFPVPCPPCLLVINYFSPRFAINLLILWLRIYLFISPIRIIWSPLYFHDYIFFPKYSIKATIGYWSILMLHKWVRCSAYTDPAPTTVAGGYWSVDSCNPEWSFYFSSEALPWLYVEAWEISPSFDCSYYEVSSGQD